jgi:hypothetical protein
MTKGATGMDSIEAAYQRRCGEFVMTIYWFGYMDRKSKCYEKTFIYTYGPHVDHITNGPKTCIQKCLVIEKTN